MSSMDDLTTWLRARLNEDEAGLRTWLASLPADSGAADWVRQWLAEVDAKRRIMDRHTMKTGDHVTRGICAECGGSDWRAGISGAELDPFPWVMPWPCPTLRLLALPYADRPGYREEWAPVL